jgi:hypothetical protein
VKRVQEDQLVADSPWLLMKPSVVTSGVIFSKTTADILKERMEMINICRLTLIRKRQHLREEFLPRPGLLVPTAETVKCIFGFNLEKDGCLEKASFNCDDCGAFCCDLHRFHTTHQDADSANILRQQITAAASKPANPVSSSSDVSQTPKKPHARNTRPDLNQRFLAITGRQTLDSKHRSLKVKEFQLIVEDLERKRGQVAIMGDVASIEVANNNNAQPSQQNSTSISSNLAPVLPTILVSSASSSNLNPPVNLSASDQVMSTFIMAMIQSNPILRDQLMSTIQSSIGKISNENHQTGILNAQTPLEEEEVHSDDDDAFV